MSMLPRASPQLLLLAQEGLTTRSREGAVMVTDTREMHQSGIMAIIDIDVVESVTTIEGIGKNSSIGTMTRT